MTFSNKVRKFFNRPLKAVKLIVLNKSDKTVELHVLKETDKFFKVRTYEDIFGILIPNSTFVSKTNSNILEIIY